MSQSSKPVSRRKESAAGRERDPAGRERPAPPGGSGSAGRPDRRTVLGICLLLVVITWVVFAQTVHFDFVNYNDDVCVYDNPVVAGGLSLAAVGWAFTHEQVANWIPLTTLSHLLDCQMFGLRPGGHHLVNVLLHTAGVVLLFLVLRRMTGRLWRSAFVAAVYAIHPLRAESVAWVSERKDVLSAVFFMLTLAAYLRQVYRPSRAGRVAVAALFALGLLAKSMLATLPGVLLLLDCWPLGRCHHPREFVRLVVEKIPLLILSAGACVAAALTPGLVIPPAERIPWGERLGNSVLSCAGYLWQMVFPSGLAIPYPYPRGPEALPVWKVGLALGLLAALSALAVADWKKRPWLLVGWLWFLGMLAPVSELLQINQDAAHADRYTYLPGIGLLIAATWTVAEATAGWKHRRVLAGSLMLATVAALMAAGYRQTAYWRNSETLWNRALACTSGNYVACVNLGSHLIQKGELAEGLARYRQALVYRPDYAAARVNLGVALFAQGDLAGAEAQDQAVLADDPANAAARENLGNVLVKQGRTGEGIAEYRRVLQSQPAEENAHFNLGTALSAQGDLAGAIAEYRRALECNPADNQARNNLGAALLRTGDAEGALACFVKTLSLPGDPPARWERLGNAFLQQGRPAEAAACYRQTLRLRPDLAGAWTRLGAACFQQADLKGARDCWQQALAREPGQTDVQNNLAWLLATAADPALRDAAKAVALAEQARDETGAGNPAILRTLAAAYAGTGRWPEAAAAARKAAALAAAQTNNALTASLPREIKYYEAGGRTQETNQNRRGE
jgi:Tfp pilus assembly protein PilF